MKPRALDSLETIEMVRLFEDIFETVIPDGEMESFGSPREIVDWLEAHPANQRPNKAARALLRG